MNQPTLQNIQQAHDRIKPYIHNTPVLTCSAINEIVGGELFFKCENFQKAGAFKSRGACNVVFSLSDEEAAHGVVTHSSGNHAAALARAAKSRGIPAYIVMPSTALDIKVTAVKGYGGKVTFCDPTIKARETAAAQIIEKTGAAIVHPYNDNRIIAGQGTAAVELIDKVKTLDYMLTPVGGGGLISGSAIAAKSFLPGISVIGCEPKNADDAYRSLKAGAIMPSVNPQTIADGLLTSLGDKTFPIIQEKVDEIVLVTEDEIINALQVIYQRMKIIVEPSSAVPIGALLSGAIEVKEKRVGIILSGGNVDMSVFYKSLRL